MFRLGFPLIHGATQGSQRLRPGVSFVEGFGSESLLLGGRPPGAFIDRFGFGENALAIATVEEGVGGFDVLDGEGEAEGSSEGERGGRSSMGFALSWVYRLAVWVIG